MQEALVWVQKAIALRETSYAQYTLGKLWLRLGKKKAARAAVERSVTLAKAAGEDTFLMEELLETIRKHR